jgi:hypothetical protein
MPQAQQSPRKGPLGKKVSATLAVTRRNLFPEFSHGNFGYFLGFDPAYVVFFAGAPARRDRVLWGVRKRGILSHPRGVWMWAMGPYQRQLERELISSG